MNILHVNAWDIHGGAARAAYRLHRALLDQGVLSEMLVQTKLSDDHTVTGPGTKISKGLAMIRPDLEPLLLLGYRHRKRAIFSPAILPFSGTLNRINRSKADLVHLHWIAGGMLRIEDLARINKPVVWSLHDDWAYTGGCHIKWACTNYYNKCGYCPLLGSSRYNDLSKLGWHRKKNTYGRIEHITINGLSSWIAKCADKSSLLKEKRIITIPNLMVS